MEKLKNKVLGRGLHALFNDNNKSELLGSEKSIVEINLENIFVNPLQPRKHFDKEKIEELALSIKEHGIIQPITVRKIATNHYQLISGERRVRASKFLCIKTIPAYLRKVEEDKILEMALIENIQRSDLNPIEIALSYQKLAEDCNFTQEEIAKKVGKKRSTIANFLRILSLPEIIKKAIREYSISMGHAKAIISLGIESIQTEILKQIINKGLSVRETENICRKILQKHNSEAIMDGFFTQRPSTKKNKEVNLETKPTTFSKEDNAAMGKNIQPFHSTIVNTLAHLTKKLNTKINIKINNEDIHENILNLEAIKETDFKNGQLIINFDSIQKLNEILNIIKK